MALLVHEVWIELDEDGQELPALLIAGPDGAQARALMHFPRLAYTFSAGSHAEAMGIYHSLFGWGAYETAHPQDFEPYPQERAETQSADVLPPE
jgi:hypothetical protein